MGTLFGRILKPAYPFNEVLEEDMTMAALPLLLALVAPYALAAMETTVTIAPGVAMPRINLGTCCGSEVELSLPAWAAAGGVGIDTALDYGFPVPGGKQTDIAAFFAASSEYAREDFFITTKIPAGIGILTGLCLGGADKALRQVEASVLWP